MPFPTPAPEFPEPAVPVEAWNLRSPPGLRWPNPGTPKTECVVVWAQTEVARIPSHCQLALLAPDLLNLRGMGGLSPMPLLLLRPPVL